MKYPTKADNYAKGIYYGYLYEDGKETAFVEIRGEPDRYPEHVEYEGRIYRQFKPALRGWTLITPIKAVPA